VVLCCADSGEVTQSGQSDCAAEQQWCCAVLTVVKWHRVGKVTVQLNNSGVVLCWQWGSGTEGAKWLCSWTTVVLHCADSGESHTHTEHGTGLHDHSHAVPALTISVLSASCAVHSFTDTQTNKNPTTVSWTVNFPHPVPQTNITLHNVFYSKAHKKRFTSLQ